MSPRAVEYHPAYFDTFTDSGSLCHVLVGFVAGQLRPHDAIATSALFAGYQLSQRHSGESWPRIGGELIEFALGMLLSRFVR